MENNIESFEISIENNIDIEEKHIISLNKFIILSIVSFGLYELWWIYKSWRFFQQKDELDIMPALRTILSIFFLIPLFIRIFDFANKKGNNLYYSVLLFICYLSVNLLSYLPPPFWLISIFSFVFLIPPFKALNVAKQNSTDFTVSEQTSFNGRQITLIIIGILFWGLLLLGLFME